jgi:ATPase subunit of ABC transporter with duplicated ATPase domains
VQSRKKQIEKLQLSDLKKSNIDRPYIKFEQKRPSGKQTLTIENISKSFDDKVICTSFRSLITKGEKIAIIGANGVGKTTLCRMLIGQLKPDAGEITWGHQAVVSYLAQDHRDEIGQNLMITEWLHSFDHQASLQDIRGLLGRMLFRGDEGNKITNALSGGEAVRMMFAKFMLIKDNVLILDEPTNHLDLESIVALGDGLQKYEGTAFVVSHDRDLIASFATRIFAFTPDGLVDFQGTYDEFIAKTTVQVTSSKKKK